MFNYNQDYSFNVQLLFYFNLKSFVFTQIDINYSYLIRIIFKVSVSLFNGISTFVGYLMPKPFSEKNSSGTI